MQGVAQLLRYLTPLVQQGNLVEQLEDVVDDKFGNEVSVKTSFVIMLVAAIICACFTLARQVQHHLSGML